MYIYIYIYIYIYRCHLCLTEKAFILNNDHNHPLNKRSELLGVCRHRRKHLLSSCSWYWCFYPHFFFIPKSRKNLQKCKTKTTQFSFFSFCFQCCWWLVPTMKQIVQLNKMFYTIFWSFATTIYQSPLWTLYCVENSENLVYQTYSEFSFLLR